MFISLKLHEKKAAAQKERLSDKAKLAKLIELDITLKDDQSDGNK